MYRAPPVCSFRMVNFLRQKTQDHPSFSILITPKMSDAMFEVGCRSLFRIRVRSDRSGPAPVRVAGARVPRRRASAKQVTRIVSELGGDNGACECLLKCLLGRRALLWHTFRKPD